MKRKTTHTHKNKRVCAYGYTLLVTDFIFLNCKLYIRRSMVSEEDIQDDIERG